MSSTSRNRLRLLRVLTRPNLGGPTRQALALQAPLAELGVDTLLVVGSCADPEPAIDPSEHGLREVGFAEAMRDPSTTGFCRLPEMGRGIVPRSDLRVFRHLRSLVDSLCPDLVHTHTSKAGALGRLAVSRSNARPVSVHTYHGLVLRDYASRPLSEVARRVERFLARRTDLCIAVSASCRDELRELGVTNDAVVVPPAVPVVPIVERDAARQRLGLPSDRSVVGFVARPAPIKRFEVFEALMQHELSRAGNWLGLAVGVGAAEVRSPTANLRPVGAIADFASYMAALDLLVLPSRREGMPLVVIEAARAGVPTVGFDVPGVRDAVRATGLGAVVPSDAGVDGLAVAVRDALRSAGTDQARASKLEGFDPAAVARRLRELYGDAVAAARSSS